MRHLPVRSAGFTLLELMITSLLGALLLMGATAMFGLFMRNSSATAIRKQINQEGQQVMSYMEYHLRNAQSVSCAGGVVSFVDQEGNAKQFRRDATSSFMSVNPGNGVFYRLHTNFATNNTSALTCAASGANSVNISFTLQSNTTPVVEQVFSNTVQVRNAAIR